MKTDPRTAADAFVKLFPRPEDKMSFETEQDEDIIFSQLRFAEQIFPHHGIMLCPVSHVRSKYVTANCENIFGRSYSELSSFSLVDFFSLIHPTDLPHVQQCLTLIKGIAPYEPAQYRFVTCYRLMSSKGDYIHMQDEKLAIRTSRNTYIHLILFKRRAEEDKFRHVKMDVYHNTTGNFVNVYTYTPKQQQNTITSRQNDIINLIAKGFTNQEIADQLHVSVHTIKNHKQILFKRTNVRNSIELANYMSKERAPIS